ncbi:MAG: hybrid sensor histidine kinase/response regulator [Bdellovibrionaceae bacterium]|nr:hybrid sensor histidine kinase/response regulator [Pseudobdellovibrionaceae bacterium]
MLPTIICIDDEAHNNEALERLLRKKYTVYSSTSPAEGLELIKKYQPAIIISDQRMPQMTGVELLEKSLSLSPDSIRLLLTGYTDLESVISAINEGQIYRYLTKPWEPQDLIITIDKAFETYQLKQELKKQNEMLKSLDKLKTDFMILVTHELRTPLTAISSFTDLLKEEIKNDDGKSYVDYIAKNTNRLHKLIEDILFITKIKANPKASLNNDSPLDVTNLLAKLAQKNPNPHDIQISLPQAPLRVLLPSEFFTQICDRLIQNMYLHAMENSIATVSAKWEDGVLQMHFSNKMNSPVHLKAEEFFSLFSRNEKVMNHTGGTGLGLSIIYTLVTNMGGTVDLNTDNEMFSLTLSLPASLA